MIDIIKHAHSGLRYAILLILIIAIFQAFSKRKEINFTNRSLALAALIITHIQVLLGLVLYFNSDKVNFVAGMMKDSILRFYGVEHILGMVIAAILITIGFSKAKKTGYKAVFSYYLIGLIIILISIPWPFRIEGTSWF